MATPSKIAAAQASDRLTKALINIAAQGLRTHCAGPGDLWISDYAGERQLAIKPCQGCPILDVCGEVASARREPLGVWGGFDRTRSPGQVGRPRRSAAIT